MQIRHVLISLSLVTGNFSVYYLFNSLSIYYFLLAWHLNLQ